MKEEVRLTWRALSVVVGVFLIGGLAIGLWIGWVAWPPEIANVDAADLKPSAQDDLIVLIADTFAYDQDVARAKTRLAELKDQNVAARVTALAKQSAAQNQSSAANLAALALALGVSDSQIALIVTTLTPTLTPTPLPTDTPTPSLVPSATPTWTPTATNTPTRTATRRLASATPKPAALAPTIWIPAFPSEWPPGAKYEAVNVASGQKFWRLTKAMFCDSNDKHDYCQDLPGGGTGTSTYVMLLGSTGARANAPLVVTKQDGKTASADDIGVEKSPDDMCRCNYSFLSSGWVIQVGGAPSDKMSGLGLPGNRHVRYFLTFQLVTR
ncbi:MAG: hypothetical protein FJ009_13265 [Chloroflexi bacterium]|nr:hypothetical protein [Chloroflexota bacterium]